MPPERLRSRPVTLFSFVRIALVAIGAFVSQHWDDTFGPFFKQHGVKVLVAVVALIVMTMIWFGWGRNVPVLGDFADWVDPDTTSVLATGNDSAEAIADCAPLAIIDTTSTPEPPAPLPTPDPQPETGDAPQADPVPPHTHPTKTVTRYATFVDDGLAARLDILIRSGRCSFEAPGGRGRLAVSQPCPALGSPANRTVW